MSNHVFNYPDTNSSRAGIAAMNTKFENQKIAIIGLGGTGSYILDLVSKTPVSEIHLFDADVFQLHNAFRAPGACPSDTFKADGSLTKVKYFKDLYSKMRTGLFAHEKYIDESNIAELKAFDFIFISVDQNKVRSYLAKKLVSFNVPFIDVGMGIQKKDDLLFGTVRVTMGTSLFNEHLEHRIGSEDVEDNKYSTNIQIADLNCLNATLAVIRWKKMIGFYQDIKSENNSLYFINTSKLLNEDFTNI